MELLESTVSHGNNKAGGLLATFGFFLEGRWNVRTPGDSSEFHPFQIHYKTTLVFTQSQFSSFILQDQFQCGMWSHSITIN